MNSPISLMLQQAISFFERSNFDSAELILKRLIKIDSNCLPAFYVLGLIKVSQENFKEAVGFFKKAAKLNPDDFSIQFNLAKALSDSECDKESLAHHKKATELSKNNPLVWLNYAKSVYKLGAYVEALECYEKVLDLKSDYAEAWSSKGGVLHKIKRYEEALQHFDKALSLKPDYAEAYSNKGNTLNELKLYEEALQHFDKALSLKPDYAEAYSNKGNTLNELKLYEEALQHFDKALSLKPDYAEAYSNKGSTLNELKLYEEALQHFDKALSLKPDYAEAYSNKGNTLNELKLYEEALQHFDKALSLKPDYAEAYSNKGNTLNELKLYEEALQHFDKALSLKPDIDWALGNRLILKLQMCNWDNLQRDINHLIEMNKSNNTIIQPFQLLPMIDNPQLHKRTSEIYVLKKYPANPELGNIHFSKQKKKIRLGYFSPDFRNHPVALLTAELFESHDRTLFEVIAFSLLQASDDDQIRIRLKNSFDKFLDVGHLSDIEIAKLARELDIDIAIDLCGHTRHSRTRIFSFRAAPIQVSYLGYLGTMGANYIDYLLADKTIITKDLEECYTEKIIYLPSYQVNDSKKTISQKKFTRKELGVSEDKIIYCCFNNNYKILPTTFDSWMRILKEVERGILFLYAESNVVEDNLIKEAKSRGIDSSRIIFGKRIKYEEYLERYKICDLFLDTLPYNAGTTASDALWAGLPVITLKGKSFASRVAASLLTAINLPELITSSQEEYEALAIKLGNNPNELIHLKKKIENTKLKSTLFDTVAFTDKLETAYLEVYDRYLLGSTPDNIDLAKS